MRAGRQFGSEAYANGEADELTIRQVVVSRDMKRGNPSDFGEIILAVFRLDPERQRDAALVEDAVIGPAADVPDQTDRWRQLQSRNEDVVVLERGIQANAIGVGRNVTGIGAPDGGLLGVGAEQGKPATGPCPNTSERPKRRSEGRL